MKHVYSNAGYTQEMEAQGGQTNEKAMQGLVLQVNIFKLYDRENKCKKILPH